MMTTRVLLTSAWFAFGSIADARSLSPQDVVVVTEDGLFWHGATVGTTATQLLPATAFGGLANPSVEWERGTNAVFVTSQAKLFRVTLAGTPPSNATITDLTPAISGATPLFFDLDVNPANDDLYVLDRANGAIHRFRPPFVLGMAPDLSVAVPKSSRSMSVDSRRYRLGLVYCDSIAIQRVRVPTLTTEILAYAPFSDGSDCDAQLQNGVMFSRSSDHMVAITVGSPNVVVDINLSTTCKPVALRPTDSEWDPVKRRLHVLAADGINACHGFYTGPNHVVRFQVPGGGPNPPLVLTNSSGSGITGDRGDLCVVHDDFAFSFLYGEPCAAPGGIAPILDHTDGIGLVPYVGNVNFTLTLVDAPASAATFLVAGLVPIDAPLGACRILVFPSIVAAVGATSATGDAIWPAAIPPDPAIQGADVFVQSISIDGSGAPIGSQGLQLHLGS